ncbi:MAG: hypothetical protein JNK04_04405 [Myxococcales bacterium]|nr:hypothetical protein [Myxococcales bacterium]
MTPYHCNEAILQLRNVRSMVDLSRQLLNIVTEDGVELELVIIHVPAKPDETLKAAVEEGIAERKRSLRGFQVVSMAEREYPAVVGMEIRWTFVDRRRGPLFTYELHCILEGMRIGYHGTVALADAAACDEWMQMMLEELRLRA